MALPPIRPGSPRPGTGDGRRIQAVIADGTSDTAAIRTLRCRTVAQGRLRQLNYIRDLPPQPVMEDEPESLLGETTAPNASEALLAALGSCMSIGIHANALAQGIPIRALELGVEADINTTAAWGAGDIHPKTIGFEAIRVSVRIDADASRKVLDALIKQTVLWSPVANTLHNPVHLDVALETTARR